VNLERISERLKSLYSSKLKTITLIIKIAAIVFVIIALFFQDLAIIFNDALKSDTTNYILAVPFIFAYLIYRKRRMLIATIQPKKQTLTKTIKYLPVVSGILLSTIAILLYWYGSYTFTPLEYHILVLPIFAAGLILILFNPQTLRQLAFPVVFLIFLIPPPSETLYGTGATLSIVSSEVSYAIVNALGIPSTLSSEYGNPVITITRSNGATIPFSVDIACSGVFSLIGFLIFVVFIAYIIRDKPWKKMTLFLIGFPLIYTFNLIRITSIVIIGYHYGEEIALQIFHLLGGWTLIFLGTLLLLTISEKIFNLQIFRKTVECPKCTLNTQTKESFCLECGRVIKPRTIRFTKNDIIKILTITTSIILITSIQAPVVALTQTPSLIINTPSGQETPATILPEISGYELNFLYRDTNFEELVKQDMAVAYLYTPIDQINKPMYVTIEIASTLSSLHRWEACLIHWRLKQGREAKVIQIELRDHQLVNNPPLIGRYFVFQYPATNVTQAVLYWYETATFVVNSTSQQKHVKISMIAYPENTENLTAVENQLLTSARTVANNWQPIKTWSPIALFLSLNGNKLVILPIMLLAGIAIFYIYHRRKEKRMNFKIYQKLSKPNQQIIEAIIETQKATKPTLKAIANTYKNRTAKSIEEKKLLYRISEIEKTGIIKSEIANNKDIPTQIWKTHMTW
jgi:exosortase